MKTSYGVHSKFDIEQHKKTFVRYLEVIIDTDGTVMYAVPSHQEKLISMACDKLNVTREELLQLCPTKYYGDFLTWLCQITKAVVVWTDMYFCISSTKEQKCSLRKLKLNGIYEGPLIKGDNYNGKITSY